jgi:hypothetical protein
MELINIVNRNHDIVVLTNKLNAISARRKKGGKHGAAKVRLVRRKP